MTDIEAIRDRWAGLSWTYHEDQQGSYIACVALLQNGERVIELPLPFATERELLERLAHAPGDVQTLLAELEAARLDAAALRRAAQIWQRAIDSGHLRTATDSMTVLTQLAQAAHPGAALLAELDAARRVVQAVNTTLEHDQGGGHWLPAETRRRLTDALAIYEATRKASTP